LEYPVQVLNDIIVPDANHAVTQGRKLPATLSVFPALRVLAAVEFDNEAPLAANKVDVVASDRLLAHEFETSELPVANTGPQREFCQRECAP